MIKRFFSPLNIASCMFIAVGTVLAQIQCANEWKEEMKAVTETTKKDSSADE